jgi:hypothetical protein
MHVDELLNAREKINKAVLAEMVFCNEQWGIEVVSYEGNNDLFSFRLVSRSWLLLFLKFKTSS